MGNSKALMLGAVTLIIGMYALKIKEADRSVAEIGGSRFEEVQALELAKTGVVLAEEELTGYYSGINYVSRTKSTMSGSVTYVNESINSTQQRITSTATVSGQTRTVVTILTRTANGSYWSNGTKYWSRWATTKTYVQPKSVDWSTQGSNPI
jgi:hypothetical protein